VKTVSTNSEDFKRVIKFTGVCIDVKLAELEPYENQEFDSHDCVLGIPEKIQGIKGKLIRAREALHDLTAILE
jgi:hypothetical protein